MASDLTVQTIRGPGSGANANKVIVPAGQTLVLTDKLSYDNFPTNSIVQQVVGRSSALTSANPVDVWAEVNTAYRVSITPKYSNSLILLQYAIPMNPTGAANILMACAPWRSTDGGSTQTRAISGAGASSGSRWAIGTAWFRSSNGYDNNDMQHHQVTSYDFPGTTSQVVYGFQFRSEGTNTTYFNYSNGDNTSWGWTSQVVIVATEIKQ
jgi:hypothetical protein